MEVFKYLYFALSVVTLFLGCSKIYEMIKDWSLREDSDGKLIVSHANREGFLLFVAVLLVILFLALVFEMAECRGIDSEIY